LNRRQKPPAIVLFSSGTKQKSMRQDIEITAYAKETIVYMTITHAVIIIKMKKPVQKVFARYYTKTGFSSAQVFRLSFLTFFRLPTIKNRSGFREKSSASRQPSSAGEFHPDSITLIYLIILILYHTKKLFQYISS
jgi:hypothetical protein